MNADTASPPPGIFDIALPSSPYPGLRAFEKNEWVIYFGREKATEKVVSQLLQSQFVALHGDSGCGKSSLVRAGVLPRLERECARGGATWRTTIMLPRGAPLWNLATALAELDGEVTDARVHEFRRVLNLGADGAERLAQMVRKDENDFVCVLVDQFEEIFQFADNVDRSEAQHFIDILTGVQRAKPAGLHFILTMRSEFLGACASFDALADTINETQYLLPRMERSDMVRALCEPARLYNGTMELGLAQRIIADAGTTQDQLPLMQHAAMRLHRRASGHLPADRAWSIGVGDYQATGGPAQILSDHADEVYLAISGETDDQPATESGRLVRRIFQAVTEDADGHMVRRPRTLGQLAELTGLSIDEVLDLLAPLRADGVSFIRIFASGPERERQIVDISHEALMRNWRRLGQWIQEETDNGSEYRRLLEHTAEHLIDKNELLTTSAARRGRKWWDEHSPTQVWADRYSKRTPGISIGDVQAFLDASLDPKKREFELWREELAMAIETHADGRRGLLTGPEVDVARRHSKDRADELTPEERFFVEQSIDADDKEKATVQRRRRAIIIGSISAAVVSLSLAVVAGIFSIIASDESRKAGEQRNEALQLKSELQGSMAQDWLADDDASAAGLLASEALSDATACGLDQARPLCSEALAALRAAIAAQRKPTNYFENASQRSVEEYANVLRASHGSRLLAIAASDNSIVVRHLDKGDLVAKLAVTGCTDESSLASFPQCLAADMAWFADGKRLLAAYYDGTMIVWDTTTKKAISTRKLTDKADYGAIRISLNPSDTLGLVTLNGRTTLFDLDEKTKPPVLRNVEAACFTSDGENILATTEMGVRLLSSKTGRPVGIAQDYFFYRVLCLPNDRAVGIAYGSVEELDTKTLKHLRTIGSIVSTDVLEAAASPNGSWLAIQSRAPGPVEIVDLTKGASIGSFSAEGIGAQTIEFASADNLLVSGRNFRTLWEWPLAAHSKQTAQNLNELSLVTLAGIEAETSHYNVGIFNAARTGLFQHEDKKGDVWLASYSLFPESKQAKIEPPRERRTKDMICPSQGAAENAALADCDVDSASIGGLGDKSFFLLGNNTLHEIDIESLKTTKTRPAPEGADSFLDAKNGLALLRGSLSNVAYPVLMSDTTKTSAVIIHPVSITSGVVGSPGDLVATGDANGNVRIWSKAKGSFANWSAHETEVRSMALSTDGSFLVTADGKGEVRARTLDGDLIGEDYVGESLTDVIIPEPNVIIAVGESGQAYRWELASSDDLKNTRIMGMTQRAFGERNVANRLTGQIYSRSENTLTPLEWAGVDNAPPEVERAFAELLAEKPLTREQRTSAGLSPSLSAIKWEGASEACETLADHFYDPDRRTAGVLLEQIDIESALQACAAARTAHPEDGKFDMLYGRIKVAEAKKAIERGQPDESTTLEKEAATLYQAASKKGYRYAALALAANRRDLSAELFEKAWNEGVVYGAEELGRRYLFGPSPYSHSTGFLFNVALGLEWLDRGTQKLGDTSLQLIGACWEHHLRPPDEGWSFDETSCAPFGKTTLSREAKQAMALFQYDVAALRLQYQDSPANRISEMFERRRRIALETPTILAGCVHIEAQARATSLPVLAMSREFTIKPPTEPLPSTKKACKAEFEKHGVVLAIGSPQQAK